MDKTLVKVFPDYMSTGVWIDGVNVSPEQIGISPGLQLALQYWHEMWEFVIADNRYEYEGEMLGEPPMCSPEYEQRWRADGAKLVELLNAENDKYMFVLA